MPLLGYPSSVNTPSQELLPTSCSNGALIDALLKGDSFSLPVPVHRLNMHLIASSEALMSHESLCIAKMHSGVSVSRNAIETDSLLVDIWRLQTAFLFFPSIRKHMPIHAQNIKKSILSIQV